MLQHTYTMKITKIWSMACLLDNIMQFRVWCTHYLCVDTLSAVCNCALKLKRSTGDEDWYKDCRREMHRPVFTAHLNRKCEQWEPVSTMIKCRVLVEVSKPYQCGKTWGDCNQNYQNIISSEQVNTRNTVRLANYPFSKFQHCRIRCRSIPSKNSTY